MSTSLSPADLEFPQYLPEPSEQRTGVALCLSGGGFRAALFHCGALRRLNELGVLSQLTTISSVSGGSMVAAHLAQRLHPWPAAGQILPSQTWEQNVAIPFRRFAATDIRTGPILKRWLSPAHILRPQTTVLALARTYQQKLTDLKLSQLPDHPRYIFCATDLTFGVNWVFERGRAGDYQIGYAHPAPADWTVALATAASSCFPPVFGPLILDLRQRGLSGGRFRDGRQRDQFLKAMQLSDGGVYDNMGLEPVWKNHRQVLVSDGGAPFPFQNDTQPFRRILRYIAVASNQASAVRKRWLIASFKKAVLQGTYWGISSDVPSYGHSGPNRASALPGQYYDENLIKSRIATIRTDMDGFSEGEIKILENHGYILADAAVQTHLPGLIMMGALPFQIPHPEWLEPGKVMSALQNSNQLTSLVKLLQQLVT